jgi:hypothetical protein
MLYAFFIALGLAIGFGSFLATTEAVRKVLVAIAVALFVIAAILSVTSVTVNRSDARPDTLSATAAVLALR